MSKTNINKKEYHFKAEMIYNQDDFLGAYNVTQYIQKFGKKSFLKSGDVLFKIIYWFVGSLFILVGVLNLVFNFKASSDFFLYTLLSIFIGIFMFLLNTNFFGKLSWRYYKKKGEKITYKFYNDYFVQSLGQNESGFEYSYVKGLYEDEKRYYLFINNKIMHVVCKNGFKIEDLNEFMSFIKEKTNLNIISI